MEAITRLAAMPGTNRLRALLGLLAAVAALSGCGSDEISGEIPQENAADLNDALAAVRTATEESPPDCGGAAVGAKQFVDAVNALPADPAAELKAELQDAGENLRTLVEQQCAATEPTGPSGTQPQETSPTTSTTTTTTPTTTDTTDTTDTTTTGTTTSTDETQPPGDGNGGGPPGGGPPGDGGTGGTGGGGTGDEGGD
jgi:hypothetical protein